MGKKYIRHPVINHREHRAKKMLPAIRILIGSHALDKDENGELLDRQKLAEKIIKIITTRYPKEVSPAQDTVVKEISKARHSENSPLDEPWSLATLNDYLIPFEIVPFLVELADIERVEGHALKIRVANWIGRLSLLADENKGAQRENETKEECEARISNYHFDLVITAANYSAHEKACERVGLIPVDTSMFDAPTLKETYKNINLYRYGTNNIELVDGELFADGQPLRYAEKELEKRLNRTKTAEYYSPPPNLADHQVGDLVQLKDTKAIVKIVKIENGIYFTEPASVAEQKLWHKMKNSKRGKQNG
jgi:hypothetical protein